MAALSIVLVVALTVAAFILFRPQEDQSFANFRHRMVRLVARSYPRMDLETSDQAQIRKYLMARRAPDGLVPTRLQQAPATGCAAGRG